MTKQEKEAAAIINKHIDLRLLSEDAARSLANAGLLMTPEANEVMPRLADRARRMAGTPGGLQGHRVGVAKDFSGLLRDGTELACLEACIDFAHNVSSPRRQRSLDGVVEAGRAAIAARKPTDPGRYGP